MRPTRKDRGTAIIAVVVMAMIVMGVVLVSLMASTALRQQSNANLERTASRNEARSGISLVAAYLDQRLNSNTAPLPKPPVAAEWNTDSSGKNYMVIYGRAANGTASCALDTGKTYAKPGVGATAATKADWLAAARTYLDSHPAAVTYLARVEIEGDWNTKDWYYHVYSVAATDDAKLRAAQTPVVLVSQAALVPYKRSPFLGGGMVGLQQVTLRGTGTLGTTDGSTSKPFIATNKNVVLK